MALTVTAMCGRYVLREVIKLREKLEKLRTRRLEFDFTPRFNAAPTQPMPVVMNDGGPAATLMRWGPNYVLGGGKPTLLVNARSETVATKALFRDSLRHRRCLVPADGFLEWHRAGERKSPHLFELADGAAFWMAGLYEEPAAEIPRSFLVLTTAANELMAEIHDRMPVILEDADAATWLAAGPLAPAQLDTLFHPYPAARMRRRPVSSLVNSARHDTPACLAPPEPLGVGETGELSLG